MRKIVGLMNDRVMVEGGDTLDLFLDDNGDVRAFDRDDPLHPDQPVRIPADTSPEAA